MKTEGEDLKISEATPPNDRLREVTEVKGETSGPDSAGPAVTGFVLLKLNGYMKPPLAEELSETGGGTTGGCSCNSVCTCVPVETCACDSVCTCDTVSSYSPGGGGGGGGTGGYWGYRPCF